MGKTNQKPTILAQMVGVKLAPTIGHDNPVGQSKNEINLSQRVETQKFFTRIVWKVEGVK